MKIFKIIGWVLLIALIVIQFIPSELNDKESNSGKKITELYQVPDDVQKVLKVSCYDCHSNKTEYPWYNKIQPVGMFLEDHVKEGKSELNFDEFGSYTRKKKDHKLEEVEELVLEGEMPLTSYTLIHWDAKISEADKKLLVDWTKELRSSL